MLNFSCWTSYFYHFTPNVGHFYPTPTLCMGVCANRRFINIHKDRKFDFTHLLLDPAQTEGSTSHLPGPCHTQAVRWGTLYGHAQHSKKRSPLSCWSKSLGTPPHPPAAVVVGLDIENNNLRRLNSNRELRA